MWEHQGTPPSPARVSPDLGGHCSCCGGGCWGMGFSTRAPTTPSGCKVGGVSPAPGMPGGRWAAPAPQLRPKLGPDHETGDHCQQPHAPPVALVPPPRSLQSWGHWELLASPLDSNHRSQSVGSFQAVSSPPRRPTPAGPGEHQEPALGKTKGHLPTSTQTWTPPPTSPSPTSTREQPGVQAPLTCHPQHSPTPSQQPAQHLGVLEDQDWGRQRAPAGAARCGGFARCPLEPISSPTRGADPTDHPGSCPPS